MPKTTLDKETKARLQAQKAKFDAEAKRHFCLRCCTAKRAVHRIDTHFNTSNGVLPHTYWICDECGRSLIAYISTYIGEIRAAQRESERPAREAQQAELRRELARKQSEARARLNAERADQGLPSLPNPSKPRAPSRAKRAGSKGEDGDPPLA